MALAQRALGKTDAEIDIAKREFAEGLSRKVAEVVGNMLNTDCECRKRLVEYATKADEERLSSLGQARERLVSLIESAYSSVTKNLMREFRIFTASNSLAFALLALVTFVRRGAALQLALPAIVLLGATLTTSGLYLFSQDWLHTILYSQYVGLAYAGYLAAVASGLADIVFNRARITTTLINIAFQVIGSAAHAVPC